MGSVAYPLKIPATVRVHPTLHVSLLKPAGARQVGEGLSLPAGAFMDEVEFWPEEILSHRNVWRGTNRVAQVLVKWKGTDKDDASCVDEVEFGNQFLDFRLEGKAVSTGRQLIRALRFIREGLGICSASWRAGSFRFHISF